MSQLSTPESVNPLSQQSDHHNELRSTTPQPTSHEWIKLDNWHGNVYSHLPRDNEVLRGFTCCLPPFKHLKKDCTCHRNIGDSVDFSLLHKEGNAKRAQEIPENVISFLTITLQNAGSDKTSSKETFMCSNPVRLPWLDRSSWCNVKDMMQRHVDGQNLRNARTYCRNARVRVLEWLPRISEGAPGGFKEISSCVVDHERDWISTVPPMISKYCSQSKLKPFCLEIDSDFEWFTVDPYEYPKWPPYRMTIKKVLQHTALHNFKGSPYWSKKVLKKLFDEITIRSIIDDHFQKRNTDLDESKGLGESEELDESGKLWLGEKQRKALTNWLLMDRIRILATVIKADLDLDLVYKLMTEETALRHEYLRNEQRDGYELDANIQKSCEPRITDTQITTETLQKFLDKDQLETFETHQRGFRAIDFCIPHEFEYIVLDKNELVPIDFGSVEEGKGGGGTVYKATIRSDFHKFPSSEKGEFAVKQLKSTTLDNASSEMKVWQLIAKEPHNHITTFLTSWSQDGHFYILSPLAKMNLEDFLKTPGPLDLLQDIKWLLEQLDGIASGIQHIHNIGRSGLRSVKTGKKASDSGTAEQIRKAKKKQDDESTESKPLEADCGYHHDLKPANILVFPQNVFKISDFGTAKIRQLVSNSAKVTPFYTHSLARGDDVYGGPDREITQKGIGRPYDIWSFGCITLQILLWVFGKGEDLGKFEDERWDERGDHCRCKPKKSQSHRGGNKTSHAAYDADEEGREESFGNFWYQCKKAKRFHLKKCVKDRLQWVKKQTKKTEEGLLLYEVYKLVRAMLNVHPGARPPASLISDRLVTLRVRAKFWIPRRKAELAAEARLRKEEQQQQQQQQQENTEEGEPAERTDVNHDDPNHAHNLPSLHDIDEHFDYDVDIRRGLESDAGDATRSCTPYPRSPSIGTTPDSISRLASPTPLGDQKFQRVNPDLLQVPPLSYLSATPSPTSYSATPSDGEPSSKRRRLDVPDEPATATSASGLSASSPARAPSSFTSLVIPATQPRERDVDPDDDLQSDAPLLQDLIERVGSDPPWSLRLPPEPEAEGDTEDEDE